jgi:sugar/nucleoside kinase (ribokinase family)
MTDFHIYGIGAALVDTEIEVEDRFLADAGIAKGNMTLVDEARQHELVELLQGHLVASKRASGGSAANSIIGASYFGARTFYSCKVAGDDNGNFYLDDLQRAGVASNFHATKESGITGKCLVMITPDAERTMNTFLGISATLSEADINYEALKQSEFLYIEGYLVTSDTGRAAAIKAREFAQRHGIKTAISFSDPGMVQFFRDGLEQMVGEHVDLAFCNEQEALSWANTTDLQEAVTVLKKRASRFAITRGSKGALVWDGAREINIAPHPVKAVDTNGAGDMFAGAFLYAITAGHDFETAGKLASRAAAEVVSDYGPRLAASMHAVLKKEVLG